VTLPAGPYDAARRPWLEAAFEAAYRDAFTRTPPGTTVEIINARVSATAEVPGSRLVLGEAGNGPRSTGGAPARTRPVYFREWGEHRPVPVLSRSVQWSGMRFEGPAIVEEATSTLVLPPGTSATVAASGNIVVEIR
jgi:N-methylhydantoinase A